MCDIICNLYNIISTHYVITLLHLWHHSLYIWNHIEYLGRHMHYLCDITATNRCHHSHSIDHITHSLYGITLALGVAFLHYTRHNILALWHQATIFMTPHPLYLTSYILYLCHNTHCLGYITPTEFLRSHPLYMITSYPLYMTSSHWMCVITPTFSMLLHPLYVGHHTHYMYHIISTV